MRNFKTKSVVAALLIYQSTAFVQPGLRQPLPATHTNSEVAVGIADAVANESVDAETRPAAAYCFIASLLLGLALGVSGLPSPVAAAPKELPKMCIRTQGCIGEVEEAWNKREFQKIDSPMVASVYTIPTTGAGRYRLFGLDYASPVGAIPETTDGTYKLRYTGKIFGPLGRELKYDQGYAAAGNKTVQLQQDQEDRAFVERVKPLLGKNATSAPSFSPFAPFDWGKTAWELQGTKVNN